MVSPVLNTKQATMKGHTNYVTCSGFKNTAQLIKKKLTSLTFAVISSEQEASNEPVGSHLTQLTSPWNHTQL